jgi:hypothetical protein
MNGSLQVQTRGVWLLETHAEPNPPKHAMAWRG